MLSRMEIRKMLVARGAEQAELFARARTSRQAAFGDRMILRGVIEVTNICRVNCDYCPMRRANTARNAHYVMTAADIVAGARRIREAGIDVILLQGGETPAVLPEIEAAIPAIRALYGGKVEIMLNLGTLPSPAYARLRRLGAVSYILKHETSDPVLHASIRHEPLAARLAHLRALQAHGFRVGTGLISGLPRQHLESVIDDIELAGALAVDMCSVSPFVPAPETPMADAPPGDLDLALNIVAVLRILHPNLLIPAVSALEKTRAHGQAAGFDAGANVMTINFTDAARQADYLIYGKSRFVVTTRHAEEIAARVGLRKAGSVYLSGRPALQARPALAARIAHLAGDETGVDALATRLAAKGVRAGQVVALAALSSTEVLQVIQALWTLDAVPFAMHTPTARVAADHVLGADGTLGPGTAPVDRRGLGQTALWAQTSGSTDTPKIARRSIASVLHEAEGYRLALGLDERSVMGVPVPVAHSLGSGVALAALLHGGRVMCDLPRLPRRLAGMLDANALSHLVVTPPLARLLADTPGHAGWQGRALIGAGSCSAELAAVFAARFGTAPVLGYGSTETGGIFAGSADLGHPSPGIEIVAPEPLSEGALELRMPVPVLGYVGQPPRRGMRWAMRDVVVRDENGTRYVGRAAGAVRINNRFIDIEPYRAALQVLAPESEIAFVSLPVGAEREVLGVAIATSEDTPGLSLERIDTALAPVARRAGACKVTLLPALPRNAVGKLDRAALISQLTT